MKLQRVIAGQSIASEMRADTWNAFVDAAQAHRQQVGQTPLPPKGQQRHLVRIENNSGAAVKRGDILGISDVSISPNDNKNKFQYDPILKGITPTSSHHGKFVVVTGYIKGGHIGWGQLDGMAVVRMGDMTKVWERADVDTSDGTQLALAPNGSAQVVWKIAPTNQSGFLTTHSGDTLVTHGGDTFTDNDNHNWALVRLGLHRHATHIGKTDGEITAGSSGTVSLWTDAGDSGDNVTAELDWMHGSENITSGKEVLVTWFPDESLWRIVGAECET